MARKTRAAKKAQDDEEQLSQQQQQHEEEAVVQEHGTSAPASSTDQVTTEKEQSPRPASPKGKGRQAETGNQKEAEDPPAVISSTSKQTMEDRKERMAELRKKMAQSSNANRKDLLLDKQPRTNNRRDVTNSRKLAKAEAILDERDAKERGEDWDRVKNWKYSIEDEERWEELKTQKEQRQDQGVIDPNSHGARSYARTLRNFKPNLQAYKEQQEESTTNNVSDSKGQGGTLVTTSSSGPLVKRNTTQLSYGSHTPHDNAIDRVVSHLNMEADVREKRHRKRPVDEGADVTYINEKNAEFNRKINRHFDEHTREIRENFERGTAL